MFKKNEGFSYNSPEFQRKNAWKLLLFELTILVVVAIIIFVTLIYLRLIPMSPNFSEITQSLSRKTYENDKNSITNQNHKSDESPKKIIDKELGCILENNKCDNAEVINFSRNGSQIYGLGFTQVEEGSGVKAAASGRIGMGVGTDSKSGQKINSLTITNDDLSIEVSYSFIGKILDIDSVAGNKIKKGQVIAFIGDKEVNLTENSKKYQIILFVKDLKEGKFRQITQKDLK